MPSKKYTAPVGTPTAGETADTVAVITSGAPVMDGLGPVVRQIRVSKSECRTEIH